MGKLDLRQELTLLLEKEIGFSGKFILEKQCKNLDIDLNNIGPENLTPLADKINWAIRGYTGEKRAEDIKKGILEYRKALETMDASKEIKVDAETELRPKTIIEKVEAQLIIADSKLAVGMDSEAETILRDALALLTDSEFKGKDGLQTKTTRHLARALSRNKESLEEAITEYEACISIGKRARQHYEVALSWNGLGAISWRAGEHKKALKHYNRALKAIQPMQTPSKKEKMKKRSAEAAIRSGLGNVHLDLLDMEAAVQNNEKALQINKDLDNPGEVGRIYNNLARVYEEMKKYHKAIDHYERGIRYSRDAGMLRMEGWTLTNLASALIEVERVHDALPHLERAEKILADFRDPIAHSKLHCMWGKYFRERGEWKPGIEHCRKSIDFVKDENSPDYLATAEEEFGTLYQKKGDKEEARELLDSALAWYEKKEETNHIERIKGQLKELD